MLLVRIFNILISVLRLWFRHFGCELTCAMGRDFQEDRDHWASI